MPSMTYAQLYDARERFVCLTGVYPDKARVWFDHYSGVTFPGGWYHPSAPFDVPDQTIRRIEQLMGPHGLTVLKAYRANLP